MFLPLSSVLKFPNGLSSSFFKKQTLDSFTEEKICMIYFSPVHSGILLMLSESPGSIIASVHVTDPFQSVLTRVLLPGIASANRTRPSLVQKQRKALLLDQRLERCELPSIVPAPLTGRGQGCFIGFSTAGRGRSSHWAHTSVLFRLQVAVLGAGSLHMAVAAMLNRGVEHSASAYGPSSCSIRCSSSALGTLIPCVRRKASAHGPLRATETRLSPKKRLDLIT